MKRAVDASRVRCPSRGAKIGFAVSVMALLLGCSAEEPGFEGFRGGNLVPGFGLAGEIRLPFEGLRMQRLNLVGDDLFVFHNYWVRTVLEGEDSGLSGSAPGFDPVGLRATRLGAVEGTPYLPYGDRGTVEFPHLPGSSPLILRGSVVGEHSLYLIGARYSSSGSGLGKSTSWIQRRDRSTGVVVPEFGSEGVVEADPIEDILQSWVEGEHLYSIGAQGVSPRVWYLVRRSALQGTLDPTFGIGGGIVLGGATSVLTFARHAQDLFLFGSHITVVSNGLAQTGWTLEKRRLLDGVLDPEFGDQGVLVLDPSAYSDDATRVVVMGENLFLAGTTGINYGTWDPDAMDFDYSATNWKWRVEKRNLRTGALVPTFGDRGVLEVSPSVTASRIDDGGGYFAPYLSEFLVDASRDQIYLLGIEPDLAAGRSKWRVERHSASTGALDPWFGSGGVLTIDFAPDTPFVGACDGAIDENFLYLSGVVRGANEPGELVVQKRLR